MKSTKAKKPKMKKTGSFFFHLVIEYIIRTVVVLAVFFLLIILAFYIIIKAINLPHIGLRSQKDLLYNKQFEQINIEKIVGKDGSIEILNENFQVVFPHDLNKTYTNTQINNINDINYYDTVTETHEFYDENNQKRILVIKESTDGNGEKWFILFDEKLNVIDSGGKNSETKKSYTQQELNTLTNGGVYKYKFVAKDNKEYTVLISIGHSMELISRSNLKRLSLIPILFIASYIICVILFMLWLSRKVKKPLVELNNAMVSYSKGELKTTINYKGPNEFVNIGNTFNDMVLKLREAERKNLQLAQEKQRILVDISHDLKTPITAIKGYTKALADGKVPVDDYQNYFNIINEKTENLTELINLFHDYSKMDHPDFVMNLKENDLSVVLRNIVASQYNQITDAGFTLNVVIPDEKCLSKLDVLQFNRCIENILNNALKYNPADTTIMVQLAEAKDFYIITIADNGVGIEPEIADKIFEPFVVGDDSRGAKHGSGLGLAICKKIIKAHHGNIELRVDYEEIYKTKFIITLPKIK